MSKLDLDFMHRAGLQLHTYSICSLHNQIILDILNLSNNYENQVIK